MKRILPILLILIFLTEAPAHAIIVDTFVGSLKYAQDQAYQAFMKLKIIEEIRILKQNFDASVRYYNEFKRLNEGRGILYNVGMQLKVAAEQMGDDLQRSVDRDFINTYKTDTKVDQFFQSIDHGIANNMKYAGDELGNLIANRKIGVDIARNAGNLSPKDAANLAVKAQGIQLQYLSQIHEDNIRIIEIHSLQLANDTRRQQAEQRLIESVRKSVKKLAPGAVREEEPK
ncbi:MAG: hypothetical protein HY921_12145 [Elusimicrobia bacterium]|nr:hypothetical protein [Elusimicrobiota bacterium]